MATFSTDTILVFETSVAQIDLPFSGVRSLWTGALFLIAAVWIERRPFNLRTLLVGAAFVGLLFAANLERILVLVMVGQVAGWRTAAEMLHVPLGVLGFGAACVAALWRYAHPERRCQANVVRPAQVCLAGASSGAALVDGATPPALHSTAAHAGVGSANLAVTPLPSAAR
jgi:exosortase O